MNPKKSHEGGFSYRIVGNEYQLDEVFRNSFQNVDLNIQTIGENSDPIRAMVDFTITIFNYLEKKKSKAYNQKVRHQCPSLHLHNLHLHFYHPHLSNLMFKDMTN
jgi:hypothetical protein